MATKSDPKSAVLTYLRAQNRPYSANDVVSNLHGEHGKAAVQKALDLLVAEGAVAEKLNGKQKAYVVDQAALPAASEQELADMDRKVKEAEEEAAKKKLAAAKAEGYVKGMEALPVTTEVAKEIAALEEELEGMEERVKSLSSKSDLVSKDEVRKLEKTRNDAVQIWRKRRRMCLNVTDAILESYPKSKKILFEEVGIETEEDHGIKMLE